MDQEENFYDEYKTAYQNFDEAKWKKGGDQDPSQPKYASNSKDEGEYFLVKNVW